MKMTNNTRKKRSLNIFKQSHKYKKVMASAVSLIIVISMIGSLIVQFFVN
ncbi:hypothetical protein [Sporanaerobium hydrogeniformans]|nr:hypothetical protein [Sporanaerobium hydrogeniformans]